MPSKATPDPETRVADLEIMLFQMLNIGRASERCGAAGKWILRYLPTMLTNLNPPG